MNNEIIVTFKGEYIQVESNGEKNIKFATDLWAETAESCKKHNCYKVLGIGSTTSPLSIIESIQIVDLFERLNITNEYRIAWVELNQQHEKIVRLIQVFLSSRGIDCKVLSNENEAKKWLFYGKMPNGSSNLTGANDAPSS